jgi:FixJ family two-component response regulator
MKAVILDDDPSMRSLLANIFHRRGYEVVSYSNPGECPIYSFKTCPCTMDQPCPCIIISDYEMPDVNGVEFIEALRNKGCTCPNIALISGSCIPLEVLGRAAKLKIKFFAKPFHRNQINDWLNQIEQPKGQFDGGQSIYQVNPDS